MKDKKIKTVGDAILESLASAERLLKEWTAIRAKATQRDWPIADSMVHIFEHTVKHLRSEAKRPNFRDRIYKALAKSDARMASQIAARIGLTKRLLSKKFLLNPLPARAQSGE